MGRVTIEDTGERGAPFVVVDGVRVGDCYWDHDIAEALKAELEADDAKADWVKAMMTEDETEG